MYPSVSCSNSPEETGRDHVARSDAAGEQELGDEGSSGSAVAVMKGWIVSKLGVRDSRLREVQCRGGS